MNFQNKTGKLFIISAPSGAGKTSLSQEVIKRTKDLFNLSRVVTFTSRQPRPGEINGTDYHFITPEQFKDHAQTGKFLESTDYNTKMYASPASITADLDNNKSLILVVDKEGAKNASKVIPHAVTIWITIPHIHDLKKRMEKRGESHTQIEKRLVLAEAEIAEEAKHHFFKYHVVNENFEKALEDILSIISNEIKK